MNALLVVFAAIAFSGEAEKQPIDFDTEIVPLLTKAGCNGAACHGAAAGRGDFRLSLFGGDPEADYHAIVYELEGRRVNLVDPLASLVIKKPALELDHGGDQRFSLDSPQAELLANWIRQGAARSQLRRLESIAVAPAELQVAQLPHQANLRVLSRFDDGLEQDVTEQAVYLANDESSLTVDEKGGLTVLRPGRHTLIVRFLTGLATVQVTAPLTETMVDADALPRQNWIDDEINATLAGLGLTPAPPAGDAAFLRRVRLDLTARLPAPDEVQRFLAADHPQKRENLVDELLQSEEFIDYWTYKLTTLLRIRSSPNEPQATAAFHGWVRESLSQGTPYDEIARTLLTAEGDSHVYGPANFHRIATGPREQTEYISELFLGARLRCANCHNHPLDRWTQDDYHGLAAIFARIDRGRHVRTLLRGEVVNPATGKPAIPRLPGERYLSEGEDGREALADWLTSPDNPQFAPAMVNRLWKSLMGRGLIEPTDDLRATNPATHPRLLDRLAEDFIAHDYDLRHTLRLIATSAAYSRAHVDESLRDSPPDDRFYSRALSRPLEPEVLLDVICDVTNVWEQFGDQPDGTRAIALVDGQTLSESLDALGRCPRNESCESGAPTGGLSVKLHFLNGPLVNAKIASPAGRLHAAICSGRTDAEMIEEFYVRALGRAPTDRERAYWNRELSAADEADRRARLEDFLWALLNSQEFATNH